MKTKITFIFAMLFLMCISSCTNIKKEYKNGKDAWEGVRGAKYDEIVEIWGKPIEIIPDPETVLCKWNSAQVDVKEGSFGTVSLSFEAYVTPFGKFEGIGKPRDLVCGDWQYFKDTQSKVHYVK